MIVRQAAPLLAALLALGVGAVVLARGDDQPAQGTDKTTAVVCVLPGPVSPLSAQQPGRRATLQGHAEHVLSLAFSPDGKTLASGSDWPDSAIRLWDVADGNSTATLQGPRKTVRSLAFSADGKTRVAGRPVAGRRLGALSISVFGRVVRHVRNGVGATAGQVGVRPLGVLPVVGVGLLAGLAPV